ncbi:hypothetical protein FQY83_06035 [Luteimonas marina]|uniref:Uncharacterized protein n=1 Tax=Luteimonas marina TaxID=488485 RepID=A0A5C5UAR3_9GAMM|nr:hypothetical protein [Luteimonas marina]TWT22572.1 hypothetical protein FQY83_06035 [Luteimonas marina]
MNAFAHFPSRLHWTAQQLADAVPLRLHELFAFDAARDEGCRAAANGGRRRARSDGGYVARSALPSRFGIG